MKEAKVMNKSRIRFIAAIVVLLLSIPAFIAYTFIVLPSKTHTVTVAENKIDAEGIKTITRCYNFSVLPDGAKYKRLSITYSHPDMLEMKTAAVLLVSIPVSQEKWINEQTDIQVISRNDDEIIAQKTIFHGADGLNFFAKKAGADSNSILVVFAVAVPILLITAILFPYHKVFGGKKKNDRRT